MLKKNTIRSLDYKFPKQLGDYRFIKKFESKRHRVYNLGIYRNVQGDTAIAKIWQGKIKNFAYYWLKNEIKAHSFIVNNTWIKIPKFISATENNTELILLTEFIQGIHLDSLSNQEKVESYIQTIRGIQEQHLDNKSPMPSRGPLYWLGMLPIITIKACLSHPSQTLSILQAFWKVLSSAFTLLQRKERSLVHRDLSDLNIILAKKDLYLLDLQLLCKADPILEFVILYFAYHHDESFIKSLTATPQYREINGNPIANRVFIAYLALIYLYHLSIQKSAKIKYRDFTYLRNNSVKSYKTSSLFWNKLGMFAFFTLISVILFFSAHGKLGNPTSSELNDISWREEGPFELSPERGRFALLYSIVEDKSFYFSLPLANFVVPDLGYKNEKYVSLFAPAVSYLAIPGYIVGKMVGASQFGAFFTVSIFAIFNVMLIIGISMRLGVSKIAGAIGSLLFLFATPAYAYAGTLYQHHISTFLILLSCYVIMKYNTFLAFSIAWLLFASSIPVDYPNLFLMLPIALYTVAKLFEVNIGPVVEIRTNIFKWFSVLSIALPLSFFLWFNQASYGNPLQFSGTVKSVSSIGQDGQPIDRTGVSISTIQNNTSTEIRKKSAIRFFNPRYMINGIYILLVSPDRGVLTFAPILVIALLGMNALYKNWKKETIVLIGIITMNFLLYSMWGDPWGGWGFGARYLIPSYAVLAIFLAAAIDRWRSNLLIIISMLIIGSYSIYINTAGALSTISNPPQIQVLELEKLSGRQELYSWDKNLQSLKMNASKSFMFQSWAKTKLTAWQYFEIITYSIIFILILATLLLHFEKRGKER